MGRRALLVEDDAAIATVITTALEAESFAVDRCDSIGRRDQLLAGPAYDVLLTDVVLTDGDGIASLPRVRSAHPSLPTPWCTTNTPSGSYFLFTASSRS